MKVITKKHSQLMLVRIMVLCQDVGIVFIVILIWILILLVMFMFLREVTNISPTRGYWIEGNEGSYEIVN